MNKSIKKKWLAALRSGKYKQGRGALRSKNNEYCCLGVLCDIHSRDNNIEWNDNKLDDLKSYLEYRLGLPPKVCQWAEIDEIGEYLSKKKPRSLAQQNDLGKTFKQIANIIQKKF